jgi:hypothetical protein
VEIKVPDLASCIFEMDLMRFSLCSAFVALAAISAAQDSVENQHYLSAFVGKSALLLGSSEVRLGGGISYGYGKHEPRFENRFVTAQIVYEGYYDNTVGNGQHTRALDSDALGFLFYSRWFARTSSARPRPFFDLGWGFQYADRTTPDLPSEINSTPVGDLGMAIPIGKRQIMASIRYLHISNAGFVKPNRGQNQIYLMGTLSF